MSTDVVSIGAQRLRWAEVPVSFWPVSLQDSTSIYRYKHCFRDPNSSSSNYYTIQILNQSYMTEHSTVITICSEINSLIS